MPLIVERALAGDRAPPLGELKDFAFARRRYFRLGTHAAMMRLARAGAVRIEVYGQNWRVITILEGEHAGLSTAPYRPGAKPYRIVDSAGSRIMRGGSTAG
jgi:hypothetical protein